jgi:cation diffusion facilitator CzcD-associated flavoprotein CzcO
MYVPVSAPARSMISASLKLFCIRGALPCCTEHELTQGFLPDPDWKRIVAKHRLGDRFIFKVEFVGSRWDSLSQTHTITFRRVESGETFEVEADVLISATGALNRPITPKVPGRDDFRGLQWHSSRWNTDVDLKGKKIAIVGNGSSGIQVIPNIADLEGIEIVQLYVELPSTSSLHTAQAHDLTMTASARPAISARSTTSSIPVFKSSCSATFLSPCGCIDGRSTTTTTTPSCRAARGRSRATCARSSLR